MSIAQDLEIDVKRNYNIMKWNYKGIIQISLLGLYVEEFVKEFHPSLHSQYETLQFHFTKSCEFYTAYIRYNKRTFEGTLHNVHICHSLWQAVKRQNLFQSTIQQFKNSKVVRV